MQLPSLPAEGVTMEATVTLECSSAHEMMVMENVPVNLAETVLPFGCFAQMTALERHAEVPVLVFDHPTLGQCIAYPIGCSHEWLLLVSSPHRLQEYQARASPNWHTCSMPTLIYPPRICCPWYTSPGWVGMMVPYATVNIKFFMAVCRSQRVPR